MKLYLSQKKKIINDLGEIKEIQYKTRGRNCFFFGYMYTVEDEKLQ